MNVPAMSLTGRCSWFGGPDDTGVAPDEGLALMGPHDIGRRDPAGHLLFRVAQPSGTTGLARRLNPHALYCAMRWIYRNHPPAWLRQADIRIHAHGRSVLVRPVDWGPNSDTGRIVDLSPGVLAALGIATDATVSVEIPAVG